VLERSLQVVADRDLDLQLLAGNRRGIHVMDLLSCQPPWLTKSILTALQHETQHMGKIVSSVKNRV
jgi:hypothetical protein